MGGHADAAQPGPLEPSDHPSVIRTKGQAVSEQDPEQADQAQDDETVHDRAQHVLASHESPIKQRETWHDHGEHQR